MTYAQPKGMMYATAGLGAGPSGISPPFRRWGFRAFDGLGALGFDRLAENRRWVFVASIKGVHGLPSGSAALVPQRIKQYLAAQGFTQPIDAGWAEGGRVWVKYAAQGPMLSDTSARRQAVLRALQEAARSIGSGVYFDVSGHGRVPAGASSAPREEAPERSSEVVLTELDTVAISGAFDTISTRDLQRLLLQKGFQPGSIDGVWGPNTAGALQQASQQLGMGEAIAAGSEDRRSVQLGGALLQALRAMPDRQAPSTPAPPAAAPTAELAPDGVFGGGMSVPDWLPWAVAAGGLAAVGGYFVWRGQRRTVAANRRRRKRRRSSRRR